MEPTISQNVQHDYENVHMTSGNMGKAVPLHSREATMAPRDPQQSTSDGKSASELFNRPGTLPPLQHHPAPQLNTDHSVNMDESD